MNGVPGFDDHLDNYGDPGIEEQSPVIARLHAELKRDQLRPPGERLTDEQRAGYLAAVGVVEDMEAGL
jgi:hypothetical protein